MQTGLATRTRWSRPGVKFALMHAQMIGAMVCVAGSGIPELAPCRSERGGRCPPAQPAAGENQSSGGCGQQSSLPRSRALRTGPWRSVLLPRHDFAPLEITETLGPLTSARMASCTTSGQAACPVLVVVHPDRSMDIVKTVLGERHANVGTSGSASVPDRHAAEDVELTLLPVLRAPAAEQRPRPRRAVTEAEWCRAAMPRRHQTVYSRILDF